MNRREVLQRAGLVLGYAVSAPLMTAFINGCKSKPALTYKPVFFDEEQARTIGSLAETIIPKTTTEGALGTGVPAFIDGMLKEIFTKDAQEAYRTGLASFAKDAEEALGMDFNDANTEEKLQFVKKYNQKSLATGANPNSFFLVTKELTVVGFFTSQVGATEVLQYNQTPGPYQGCVPLAQVGKQWAT